MRLTIATRLFTAALLVVGEAGAASAQTTLGGMKAEGQVEAGIRGYLERPLKKESAKFDEYRDNSAGLLLQGLDLRLTTKDDGYSASLSGSKWGFQDQEFALRSGRTGLWQFGFDWDQLRHVFSTDSRMLATEQGRGVFMLPSPRPAGAAYNTAPLLDEISVRWDTARMFFTLTPSPDLEIRAQYTRVRKDGDRPKSLVFGSPGSVFMEVVEPIEQTVHDFRLSGSMAREQYQLQASYVLSVFQNDIQRMLVDNPCFDPTGAAAVLGPAGSAAACAAGDRGVTRGQVSLPPNNMAHTLNLAGGVNLPMRTRLSANLGYSLHLQNDEFLPHTVNPTAAGAGGPNLALPRHSLNGNEQIILANINATTRIADPLTLSAKYRLYKLMDLSNTITFPGQVVDDQTFSAVARRAGRWPFTRHNADIDARVQIFEPMAFTLGTGWERWDRGDHREVPESDEFFGKAKVDATPWDWLLARLTYTPSFRVINKYNTRAHAEHSVVEDPGGAAALQGQSILLRKFDESERNRHKIDVQLQLTPMETLSVSPTIGYKHDDFNSSRLGLQHERNWSAGTDVNWTPVERVSFSTGYMHEEIYQKMRSRSRPVTGTTTFDFLDFEWVSNALDTVDTVYLNAKTAIIPSLVDLTLGVNYSTSTGRIDTRNPIGPFSGTAAQNTTAKAQRQPAFDDQLMRLDAGVRYYVTKAWSASFAYAFEDWTKHDWRTDTLNPWVGTTAIYLGNDLKNYTAHIVGITLAYKFK